MTSIEDMLDETDLMDCEFREDAIQEKSKQDLKQQYQKPLPTHSFVTHWDSCYRRDLKLLTEMEVHMDFSYLAIGLRGSGCSEDKDEENAALHTKLIGKIVT